MIDNVTVIVPTKNSKNNISKCLDSLVPYFQNIVVVDSNSHDGTCDIVKSYSSVDLIFFNYTHGYPKKRQWVLDNFSFKTDWVFLVDSDEEVSSDLASEISTVVNSDSANLYFIKKDFHFMGKRFKYGGFSFFCLNLFKIGCANFEELGDGYNSIYDMEIHERMVFNEVPSYLKFGLIHDNIDDISSYIQKHNVYSSWESNIRLIKNKKSIPLLRFNPQSIRRLLKSIIVKMPFEPVLWFFYHYVFCLGFLEGRRGFIASAIRCFYIFMIRWKMYERNTK
jgi:glycosyltransferase involved in cell wall biosynthesis